MSWEKCVTVSLNSDSTGCFYTGDIVTGTVILDLDKDKKIESIDMEIVGISKAQWTRPMPTIPYVKIYSEKKKILYIKTDNIFANFKYGNIIKAGIYSYPFHFALPQDLPSTFKSSIAKVYYSIKIKSKPKSKIRKVFPFNVLGNINVNNLHEMLRPHVYEFNKIFKSVSGKVTVHIKTYKAITPRQTIPFEVTINNEKRIRISELNITLVQKLRYTVSSGYANDEKKITKIAHKNIGKTKSEFCDLKMEIPQVTPSSIQIEEPMIDISYIFRIEICFPFHFNFYEDIPVMIATAPVIHHDF